MTKRLLGALLASGLWVSFFTSVFAVQAAPPPQLIQVPLPLMGADDERIIRQLEEIVQRPSNAQRPVVVLEFTKQLGAPSSPQSGVVPVIGRGTPFPRALSLALWLSGPRGSRLKSIAYLPESVEGHAVLIALACDEVIMRSDSTLGNASSDDETVDEIVRKSYVEVSSKRSQFPKAAVISMLDGSSPLIPVVLLEGGEKYLLEPELQELRGTGKIKEEKLSITVEGAPSIFSGAKLRELRWIANTVEDRSELQNLVGAPLILEVEEPIRGPFKVCVIEIHGNISEWMVKQVLRGMESSIARDHVNLIFLDIDSPGGSPSDSLRLAEVLSGYDRTQLKTIAYISGEARGDAALIAMSCSSVYAAPDAKLGGGGEATITLAWLESQKEALRRLAEATGRSEGELYGPICPELETFEYANAVGARKWFAAKWIQEVPWGNEWIQGEKLEVGDGIEAKKLVDMGWIRGTEPSLATLANKMEIDQLPERTQSSGVEMFVQRLGQQPWLPPLLLMIAFMTLMSELSSPGIGVAGFCSIVCFVLFFWIRFLNGTVEWLEVLLFIFGMLFIAIEFFVLPGSGIFGFGGILMVLTSVVLASQTFLFPANRFQLIRMAWNTTSMMGVFMGIGLGLYVIRNQIEKPTHVSLVETTHLFRRRSGRD